MHQSAFNSPNIDNHEKLWNIDIDRPCVFFQFIAMSNRDFLHFVGIGAMKAGTTSLHHYLAEHPELSLSSTKEINFFNQDSNWNKGINWYKKFFKNTALKCGEINPNYAMLPNYPSVPERLYQVSPNLKIIYILRDPIERFRSHIHHNYVQGCDDRSIEEILTDQDDSLRYISYGKYFYQINHFLSYFDRSQIMMPTLEDLSTNMQAVLSDIFDFLEVDASFFSGHYRDRFHVANEHLKPNLTLQVLRKISLAQQYQRLRPLLPSKLHVGLKSKLGTPVQKPQLTPQQVSYLSEVFADDVRQLEAFLGRKLDEWQHF